ncbi:MAG: autotransporter outer membrane beta-barrel domain-containing protein, partial [Rickettsiales bacterium]|nr:autotransporter outer membrane beta-barrel domain-containing protein [Rickettsiales bacterium]
MKAAVTQTTDMISERLQRYAASSEGAERQDFGGGTRTHLLDHIGETLSVWTSVGHKNINDDFVNTESDGSITTFMTGIDGWLTKKLLAGLSLAYEHVDVDTQFNSGTYEAQGLTVAPYALYKYNDTFSVDATVGYTQSDIDLDRSGGSIAGNTDANRYFTAFGINHNHKYQGFEFGSRLGYLYSYEEVDGFAESNGTIIDSQDHTLSHLRIGTRVAYPVTPSFKPYVGLRYEYDLISADVDTFLSSEDEDGVTLITGFNFTPRETISTGLRTQYEFGRSDQDSLAIIANIQYQF